MAARRERGLLDPDAAPGESPSTTTSTRICSDGDLAGGRQRRGVLARRAPAARQPHPDLRRQPDLASRTTPTSPSPRTSPRATRPTAGTCSRRLDQRRHRLRRGRPGALRRRSSKAATGHRPAQPHRPAHDHRLARAQRAEHRHGPRLRPRRRRGRRHQEGPRLRPRRRPSRSPPDVLDAHPRACATRGAARPRPRGSEQFDAWAAAQPRAARRCFDRMQHPHAARRLGRRAARRSTPTPRAWPPARPPARCSTRSPPVLPELWGGSADLAESNNTTIEGAPSFLPDEPADQARGRATRTAGCCTSASASTPWARS